MFVTCRCQHCNGGVEFEDSNAGETIACPHCNLETLLYVPQTLKLQAASKSKLPKINDAPIIRSFRSLNWKLRVLIIFIASLAALFLLSCLFDPDNSDSTHEPGFFAMCAVLLLSLVGLALGLAIYFFPYYIACQRKKKNKEAILVLNLLLGWTIFGWAGAMIWAYVKDEPNSVS